MSKYNKLDRDKIKKFEKENVEFLQNRLVSSFLKIPSNKNAYVETITNPTQENKEKLDTLFKQFYLKVRFISYISTTLKYNSINYDKHLRLIQFRYSTILDAPISNDREDTYQNLFANQENAFIFDEAFLTADIKQQVTCPLLYKALSLLTEKQIEIINLAYVDGLSDTEIARVLNKTQQAISKTHKKALKNILTYFKNQGYEIRKGGIYYDD